MEQIRRLVDESFVPSTQQASVLFWRLSDFYCPSILYIYCDAYSCISAFFTLILGSDVYKAFYGHRFKKKNGKFVLKNASILKLFYLLWQMLKWGKISTCTKKNVFGICYVKNFVIWRSLAKLSWKKMKYSSGLKWPV